MSYQKEREEFIARYMRWVPNARLDDARAFLRAASASQRFAEISSSIDVGERELARLERADERRDERVRQLCQRIGVRLETNGDPRGNPYCLLVGEHDFRISVPGRGLPARCFQ